MIKILFRSVFLLVFAALILWTMGYYNLFDFALILQALSNAKSFLIATALTQLVVFVILLYRYILIVRAFGVGVQSKDLAAATFVSVALGQWAPGSLAFMEAIRMSLTFGSDTSSEKVDGAKARLIAASFYDRLLGFVVILAIGFCVTIPVCVWQWLESGWTSTVGSLALLAVFSLGGSIALLSLPFLSRWAVSKKILLAIHSKSSEFELGKFAKFATMVSRVAGALENLRHVLAAGGTHFRRFLPAMLVSALASILTNVVTYLAALSIGTSIPFVAIVATFPVIAIVGIIPMGFAGIGGYQLVTIALLQIFGVDARVASAASLMQTAVSLLMSTFLGLLFARASLHQIKRLTSKKVH